MASDIVTTSVENRVAVVRLNRPDTRNALSSNLVRSLTATLDRIDDDNEVKVVVLTGTGEHFAAGADISEMAAMTLRDVIEADFRGCCTRLADLRKPAVAAVDGYALGGGCELVEMCDIVIAAETARFGHPEIKLGTMSGAGGTQRLSRVIGKHRAMDLLLTGRTLAAGDAERWGLVTRVVPRERLMDEALMIARQIASLSAPVVAMLKESVGYAFRVPLEDGLALERRLFHMTFATEDRMEGMKAFLENRPPRFMDR